MKKLNILPVEDFLEKSRLAIKTNQKNLTLSIKEVSDLQFSLSLILARLVDKAENQYQQDVKIQLNMDGGKF